MEYLSDDNSVSGDRCGTVPTYGGGQDGRGAHTGKRTRNVSGTLLGIIIIVIAALGLSVLLRNFVYQAYQIPSGSMEETIQVGDMLFSEKVSYYFRSPERGDVVTFTDPLNADRVLIKRCIATEGQTVDLVDGTVCVDGVPLDEPYTLGKPSEPLAYSDITYPVTVPSGCIWVMGDNRTNSQDSRYFGSIPVSSVTGRGAFVYWPPEHFGKTL